MPYIRVTVSDPDLAPAHRYTLAGGLTDLAVSALGKSAARTTVHVNQVPADHFFIMRPSGPGGHWRAGGGEYHRRHQQR